MMLLVQFISQRRLKLFIYTLCAFGIGNEVGCFTLPANSMLLVDRSHQHITINKSLVDGWINDNQSSEHEMDVHNIILTLSKVADDQSRRERLSQLFEMKLRNQDDGELFMKQFDSAMIFVGDRIRLDAANAAADVNQLSNDYSKSDKETEMPRFPLRSQQASQLESQLWACIDMMVQSKMLMKKARMK
jgi:hypothetical protein